MRIGPVWSWAKESELWQTWLRYPILYLTYSPINGIRFSSRRRWRDENPGGVPSMSMTRKGKLLADIDIKLSFAMRKWQALAVCGLNTDSDQ